jgi:hypothetical protein
MSWSPWVILVSLVVSQGLFFLAGVVAGRRSRLDDIAEAKIDGHHVGYGEGQKAGYKAGFKVGHETPTIRDMVKAAAVSKPPPGRT